MPFVLLVLAMLGGGLICLLVINTTLGATSFQIDHLQQAVNARALQARLLQEQIAEQRYPARIAQEARNLGMRPERRPEWLNLRTHRLAAGGQEATAGVTR
jgi:hypothetical protein